MATIVDLTEATLDRAMELVTESYDFEVSQGARDEDYLSDWEEARGKLKLMTEGMPYSAMMAFEDENPVGLSVFRISPAYGEEWAVWDWFYISRMCEGVRGAGVGLKLARSSINQAIDRGTENVVGYVGTVNARLQHTMEKLGMVPYEIELRGSVESMRKGLVGHGTVQQQG